MTIFRRHLTLLLAVMIAAVSGMAARAAVGVLPEPAPGDTVSVSILTAAPGSMVYELEGHTMMRLQYGDVDAAVSWGVFDFNAPNFLYRFVKGETDYMAAAFPTGLALREYAGSGRRVTEQPLNLSPEESRRVVELVNENLRPENATYRYNYLYDNCATRPIDLIEKAVGDTVRFQQPSGAGEERGITFRDMMRQYHRNYPWYQFGIDLALGSGIDQPVSDREACFAPVRLSEYLPGSTFSGDGQEVTLRGAKPIVEGNPEGIQDSPTPWWLGPDAVCWAFAILCGGSLALSWKRGRRGRLVVSMVFGINFLAGLLLTFLIFVSVHEATSPNWLYLWLNPLCIAGVIGVWLKKTNLPLVCYHFANFVAITTLAGIDVAEIQSLNSAFYPLMLLDAAISLHYLWLYRKRRENASPTVTE